MNRAIAELTASIESESEAGINFWIAQLRTVREVFQERLIAYQEHYEDCAACHGKNEPVIRSP
jgi:hypothetical protein